MTQPMHDSAESRVFNVDLNFNPEPPAAATMAGA
jgi:hypothetical protein